MILKNILGAKEALDLLVPSQNCGVGPGFSWSMGQMLEQQFFPWWPRFNFKPCCFYLAEFSF